MSLCARVDVFIELSYGLAQRDIIGSTLARGKCDGPPINPREGHGTSSSRGRFPQRFQGPGSMWPHRKKTLTNRNAPFSHHPAVGWVQLTVRRTERGRASTHLSKASSLQRRVARTPVARSNADIFGLFLHICTHSNASTGRHNCTQSKASERLVFYLQ